MPQNPVFRGGHLGWKSSLGCIVVFYYDVAAAAASGVDEDDLHDDHEFVEHSSVDEIMEWCAGSE